MKSQTILLSACRLVIFTPMRMLAPFLPAFSRGLGVDLTTISLAITAAMAASAISPFLAPIAERRGRRAGMLTGLLLFLSGVTLLVVWPAIPAFFIALFLITLGDNVFAPASQAYLGDQTPYAQRATALAVFEMGWSLSFILCVPLMGLLIARFGWHSPFTAIAGAGIFMVLLFLRAIPKDTAKDGVRAPAVSMLSDLRTVLKHAPARAGLALGMIMLVGNTVFTLVFGVWMENSYGLKITALGLAAAVLGFSELGGEALAAWLSDRIGKERSAAAGLAANLLAAVSLHWLAFSLWGALLCLVLFYISYEFAMVSTLPLMSEILPAQRATTMAVYIAAASLGVAIGAWLAPLFYLHGMWANALACAALDLIAIIVLTRVKIANIG
jgi:predicted MFS family arabinose efflux permease